MQMKESRGGPVPATASQNGPDSRA